MDQDLLEKYFADKCSEDELEQVLDWFETDEGRAFLQEDINQQTRRFAENGNMFLYPEIESAQIFGQIQRHKKRGLRRKRWFTLHVASILLAALVISSLLYQAGIIRYDKVKAQPIFISYATAPGQQKVFTLSDGTKIRLNERSTLTVPKKFRRKKRKVKLEGEAFFAVVHDSDRPFIVRASGARIKDLGTKFDVKTDSAAGKVQVAVIQGKVALKKEGRNYKTSAILTRNHFAILRLSNSQITIEKENVHNYLSWINNRLIFNGQSLGRVSRQLERLYDVKIAFKTNSLKKLNLTANFEKTDLKKVLGIMARTLGIHFKLHHRHVTWMR